MYATNNTGWEAPNATVKERQEALEEFIDYVLDIEDVRIIHTKQLLTWMRNPVPLDPTGSIHSDKSYEGLQILRYGNRVKIILSKTDNGDKIAMTIFDVRGRTLFKAIIVQNKM